MVYCVAYGCSNGGSSGKSFFRIINRKKSNIWIRNISRHRKNLKISRYSTLCQEHFTADQFVINPTLAATIGYKPGNLRLKSDAVPTLFKKALKQSSNQKERRSEVIQKRRKFELLADLKRISKKHSETSVRRLKGKNSQSSELIHEVQNSFAGESSSLSSNQDGAAPVSFVSDEAAAAESNSRSSNQGGAADVSVVSDELIRQILSETSPIKQASPKFDSTHSNNVNRVLHIEEKEAMHNYSSTCTSTTSTSVLLTKSSESDLKTAQPVNISLKVNSATQTRKERQVKTPRMKNAVVQTTVETKTKMTQTDETNPDKLCFDTCDISYEDDPRDCDYDPLLDDSCDSEPDSEPNSDDESLESNDYLEAKPTGVNERKFIVFESCLFMLLSICSICFNSCKVAISSMKGSRTIFTMSCAKGHVRTWCSQPHIGSLSLGNLELSASLFFSGCSPAKVIAMFRHMNILSISKRTYFNIQKCYLVPAIISVWNKKQQKLFSELREKNEELVLGGDARCDSPGHSAKYASYNIMNLKNNQIIETQLIQSNECTSSNAMELEGLKRCLAKLKKENLKVKSITTDRHPSIRKFLRENMPWVKHFFDVWHVAKSVMKKLLALGGKKGFETVRQWAKSIGNHLYWSAATSNGNPDLIRDKWVSVLNHVANIHDHESKLFSKCEHGDLQDREWMIKGSRAHKSVREIITNTRLLSDICKLSPGEQTSNLESFHKVICYFAPKSTHFFYSSMRARTLLACLHFNENCNRAQKSDKDGNLQWAVSYPKYMGGKGTVRSVNVQITYGYVQELFNEVRSMRDKYPTYKKARAYVNDLESNNPDSITSCFEKQNKMDLVHKHVSRFNIS